VGPIERCILVGVDDEGKMGHLDPDGPNPAPVVYAAHDHMESSSTISPEQQLADGPHTVWEAREHTVEGLLWPTGGG
jgi:hypothetical protein